MFTLKKHSTVHSLEEAYELLHNNRNNVILGGLMWMKLGNKHYHTGIDLSKLNLDYINETKDTISIGAMTTLRALETNELINAHYTHIVEAVKDIVGIQFRNSATIGASVYSKYGFSDIITSLLIHKTYVRLFHHGLVSLDDFLTMKIHKDILVEIIIHKDDADYRFLSQRYNANDFSLVNVAVAYNHGSWCIAVGARPSRAKLAVTAQDYLNNHKDRITDDVITKACDLMAKELNFGTNLKASATYREALAKVLMKRGIKDLCI